MNERGCMDLFSSSSPMDVGVSTILYPSTRTSYDKDFCWTELEGYPRLHFITVEELTAQAVQYERTVVMRI